MQPLPLAPVLLPFETVAIEARWRRDDMHELADPMLAAFLLDEHYAVISTEHFVFDNQRLGPENVIEHQGAGYDSETILVVLDGLLSNVHHIVIATALRHAINVDQPWSGGVELRIFDPLSDPQQEGAYTIEPTDLERASLVVAVISRAKRGWMIEAIDESIDGGIAQVAQRYGLMLEEDQSSSDSESSLATSYNAPATTSYDPSSPAS